MTEATCPHCGANLQAKDLESERCPHCHEEFRPANADEVAAPEDLVEEASKDSYPASDPPAW